MPFFKLFIPTYPVYLPGLCFSIKSSLTKIMQWIIYVNTKSTALPLSYVRRIQLICILKTTQHRRENTLDPPPFMVNKMDIWLTPIPSPSTVHVVYGSPLYEKGRLLAAYLTLLCELFLFHFTLTPYDFCSVLTVSCTIAFQENYSSKQNLLRH